MQFSLNHKIKNLQYSVTINQVISQILQHQKRSSHSYWQIPQHLLFSIGPAFREFILGHLLSDFSLEETEAENLPPYPSEL